MAMAMKDSTRNAPLTGPSARARTSSYRGLANARWPLYSPTRPVARRTVPGTMPAMLVRPKNSNRTPPVSSNTWTSSDLPAVVPTCTDLTRPSIVTRSFQVTLPISVVPFCRGGLATVTAGPFGRAGPRPDASAGARAASCWRPSMCSTASARQRGVEGHDRRRHVWDPPDSFGDAVGRAVVQQTLRQSAEGPPGQQDGYLGAVLDHGVQGQLGGAAFDPATVRALDDRQREAVAELALDPLPLKFGRDLTVDGEVHGPDLGGPDAAGVAQGTQHGKVQAVDEDEHRVPGVVRGIGLVLPDPGDEVERSRLATVLGVQAHEQQPQQREQHDHQPGALGELHDGEDQHHRRRDDPAGGVDASAAPPARFSRWWW